MFLTGLTTGLRRFPRVTAMKSHLVFVVAIVAGWPAVGTADSNLYKSTAGPHIVHETIAEWRDEARARDIPVKIYAPKGTGGAHPVVIVSHGLGGSREGLAYLGKHWASHGYVSVHLQHAGSDQAVWQGRPPAERKLAMRRAATDPHAAIARPWDVRFAIDRVLTKPITVGTDKLLVDVTRLAVAGHSFGAFTALASAGVTFGPAGGLGSNYGDDRLVAAIALSAPAFRGREPSSFDGVCVPTLHMTGTDDHGVVVDAQPDERRNAYDRLSCAHKYLVILDGGDHMVFSGVRRGASKSTDPQHWAVIKSVTTAFLDFVVNQDPLAAAWMTGPLVDLPEGVAVSEQWAPSED